MDNLFKKLIQLKSIASTNDKINFISMNEADTDFIKVLKFLLDDLKVTNISRKKIGKSVDRFEFKDIHSLSEFIDFLSNESTGKDYDISTIQNYIDDVKYHTSDDMEILESIACKDLSLGCGVKLFNKAVGTINQIETIKYMGARTYDEKVVDKILSEGDTVAQIKADGTYCNIFILDNKVTLFTRNGQQMFLNNISNELSKLNINGILCGELVLKGYNSDRRSEANGLIRALISSNQKVSNGDEKEEVKFKKKTGMSISEVEELIYVKAWDFLDSFEDKTLYKERFKKVNSISKLTNKIVIVESRLVKTKQDIVEYFNEVLSNGEEGLIIKSLNKEYKDGKPNFQVKYKLTYQCELRIKGFVSGAINSKYENTLGALCCESEDGLIKTKLSGMSDELREILWDSKDKYLNKIIEIECSGISQAKDSDNYSFFFPRFKDFRLDKDKADTYEEILAIQNSILNLKAEI